MSLSTADMLTCLILGSKVLRPSGIAAVARTDFELVQSLTTTPATPLEAALTAQFPFQTCPDCSLHGLALKHWRRAWVFDCLMCGAQLVPIILGRRTWSNRQRRLLRRALIGARLLEGAIKDNNVRKNSSRQARCRLRRGGHKVSWAAPRCRSGLQPGNPDRVRSGQSARSRRSRLLKAARIMAEADGLRQGLPCSRPSSSKEPHLPWQLCAASPIARYTMDFKQKQAQSDRAGRVPTPPCESTKLARSPSTRRLP